MTAGNSKNTLKVELLTIKNFLGAAALEDILSQMRTARSGPATVYGREADGAVETLVRKVTRVNMPAETLEHVTRQLLDRKGEIESYFGEGLGECEEPQFLRYQEGDFFIPHQDGNTPLILDESRLRKVSIVIFLSAQAQEQTGGAYSGGSLVLHGTYPNYEVRFPVTNDPGTLVAFRAQTTHEVTPVTYGERYTIVSWYR
jgi:SM-20-related protein